MGFHRPVTAIRQKSPGVSSPSAGQVGPPSQNTRTTEEQWNEQWPTLVRQLFLEASSAARVRSPASTTPTLLMVGANRCTMLVANWPDFLRASGTSGLGDLRARCRRWCQAPRHRPADARAACFIAGSAAWLRNCPAERAAVPVPVRHLGPKLSRLPASWCVSPCLENLVTVLLALPCGG